MGKKKLLDPVNANVNFERRHVESLDRIAQHRGVHRTDIIRTAVRHYINRYDPNPDSKQAKPGAANAGLKKGNAMTELTDTPVDVEVYRSNGREASEDEEKDFARRLLQYCKPVGLLDGKMMATWDETAWIRAIGYVPLVVVQDYSELLETEVVTGYVEGLQVPQEWL